MHLILIVFNKFASHVVLLFENTANFSIHFTLSFFRDIARMLRTNTQVATAFAFCVHHHAELVAHTVTRHHITSHLRSTFEVVRCASRHLVHKDFFGNTTTKENR